MKLSYNQKWWLAVGITFLLLVLTVFIFDKPGWAGITRFRYALSIWMIIAIAILAWARPVRRQLVVSLGLFFVWAVTGWIWGYSPEIASGIISMTTPAYFSGPWFPIQYTYFDTAQPSLWTILHGAILWCIVTIYCSAIVEGLRRSSK